MEREPYRIFVVEDNAINQKVILAVLQKLGFIAKAVTMGQAAIEALCVESYDLVLMDLMLPDMDGFEATRRIRTAQPTALNPEIPILALTADTYDDMLAKCLESGMNGYLAKPVEPAVLLNKIQQYLPGVNGTPPYTTNSPTLSPDRPMKEVFIPDGEEAIRNIEDNARTDRDQLAMALWEETMRKIGGDAQAARQFLEIVLDDTPPLFIHLEAALQKGELKKVVYYAHTIKGESANLGARRLYHQAMQIEELAMHEKLEEAVEQTVFFRKEFDNVVGVIQRILKKNWLKQESTLNAQGGYPAC